MVRSLHRTCRVWDVLQFKSGKLHFTGEAGLVVDSNGPLSSLVLQTGDRLDVAQTLAITSGGTVQVSGGILQYDRLAVQEAGSLNFGDTGLYLLGRTTDNTVISLAGTLGVGSANVSLVDADGVDLGKIDHTSRWHARRHATGFALDGDDEISGYGRLFGDIWLSEPTVLLRAAARALRVVRSMYPAQDRSVTPRFMGTLTWVTALGS